MGEAAQTSCADHSTREPLGGLFHFDARREGVFQLLKVGDDQHLGKIRPHQVDGLDQALAAVGILRAKTFVDDQGLQPGAGPLGQHPRKRQPDGKIDPESFAAGE